MNISILYDPVRIHHKIKLTYKDGKGLTVQTEKPMPFSDAVRLDSASYDHFLYEMKFCESETITELIYGLRSIDFPSVINSTEGFQMSGFNKVILTYGDSLFSLELTLQNPETSKNPEVKRIHQLLLKLFDHIEMSEWYNLNKQNCMKNELSSEQINKQNCMKNELSAEQIGKLIDMIEEELERERTDAAEASRGDYN